MILKEDKYRQAKELIDRHTFATSEEENKKGNEKKNLKMQFETRNCITKRSLEASVQVPRNADT